MPFDAIFLSAVAQELRQKILGLRIEKIQQPARDTVILQLRGKEKLLLSANVNRPRIHLSTAGYENPAQPPMFCMLLRKHLSGGRIAAIGQPPAERVVDLSVDCTDEMGIPCRKHLILELMGRNSNLILTAEDGHIIDCLRRVDLEMSELRQVLPGLFYRQPPRQGRRLPGETGEEEILSLLRQINSSKRLDKWLIESFDGFSPLVARELSYGFSEETDADILSLNLEKLAEYLQGQFCRTDYRPILLSREGQPSDYSYRPIFQYGSFMQCSEEDSFSRLLDLFYSKTEHSDRMRQKTQTLRKSLTTLRERTLRKLELQRKEYESTLDRESLRQKGDIVTANLHAISRGQTLLRTEDFYHDMVEIEIPLKPELSPQQNAARYYKEYTKAKNGEKILSQQIRQGELEADYLGTVLDELSRVENEADLAEIRMELEQGGYVRRESKKQQKQPKTQPVRPMEFRSSDGYTIYVGKNNRQNDLLSLKMARKDDLWLHIQKFHGTHVIIVCGGTEPPDQTVTEAAQLAAFYSQAREGQNVPVDVTPVRFLKKPNGAKPGMVVYDKYRTVIVTPEEALAERLRVRE
ncbi:MAG: NFACT family protein [Oscillospiraceae bacterium]|nr:NFACT family protein [Oscillospiraceae bacterium]